VKTQKIKVASLGICACNQRERLKIDSSSTRTVDRIYFLKKVGLEQDHRSYIILNIENLLVLSLVCGDTDENDDTKPKPRTGVAGLT